MPSNFQLIETGPPHELMDQPEFVSLFGKVIAQKILAFKKFYGSDVVVFDRIDLVSRYFLVCTKVKGEWHPLSGFHVQELSKMDQLGIEMPGVQVARFNNCPRYLAWVEEKINHIRKHQYNMIWFGGYFAGESHRLRDVPQIRRLISAMVCNLAIIPNTTSLTLASQNANILKYFKSLGFRKVLGLEGEILLNPYFRTEVELEQFESLSDEGLRSIRDHETEWNNRLIFRR